VVELELLELELEWETLRAIPEFPVPSGISCLYIGLLGGKFIIYNAYPAHKPVE
jgi:hypothetical protein